MQIVIELADNTKCDGCPLLLIGEPGKNSYCRHNFQAILRERSIHRVVHHRDDLCIEENK